MEKNIRFVDEKGNTTAKGIIYGEMSNSVHIYEARKGFKITLEAAESGQPLVRMKDDGKWSYSTGTTSENQSGKKLGFFGQIAKSWHDTKTASLIGEVPQYLGLEAITDNASATIGTHDGMKVISLEANEMPYLVRRGGFFLSQKGVRLEVEAITKKNGYGQSENESRRISDELGFRYFQKIRGYGIFVVELHGDCDIIKLRPGEKKSIDPKCLIAMSYSVNITKISTVHPEGKVRYAAGIEYELILQANALGGIVIISHYRQEPPKNKDEEEEEKEKDK